MTFEQSFDALSSVKGGLNNMIIYGSSLINMRPDIINKARIANEQALVTLLNRVKRTFRADLVGKPFASDAESLIQEVEPLDPNTLFTNSEKAYAVADSMQTILRKMMLDRDRILNNPKASEAELLVNAKDKKLHQVYKGLSTNVVCEAFNWNDNFMVMS